MAIDRRAPHPGVLGDGDDRRARGPERAMELDGGLGDAATGLLLLLRTRGAMQTATAKVVGPDEGKAGFLGSIGVRS